jgi:glycosyltransferase involved in cell wall biosynthesis
VKPCLLIPIYNHGHTIAKVVEGLACFDLPCLIVDDGSDAETRAELDALNHRYAWVEVLRLSRNGGRGVALKAGYRHAAELGMTHAVQLDADGQHDASDVPHFIKAAKENPRALILGEPIFDSSAPTLRLYGRKLSKWLVWLETFSTSIHDPLCGFRCFPLAATLAVLDEFETGDRMDFDVDIVVRLAWSGVPVDNTPTHVVYHEGGLSHFQMVRDNARLIGLHTRLVVGGVRRRLGLGPRLAEQAARSHR